MDLKAQFIGLKWSSTVNTLPEWVCNVAQMALDLYGGDASRIWSGHPTAATLQNRFLEFQGVGQKKAAMAVEILVRDLKIPIEELEGSDVAYDVHVRRVFLRTGIATIDEPGHMIEAARRLGPRHPGAIDLPAWIVGRQWCDVIDPLCSDCPIDPYCPKFIERAANVRSA